MIERQKFIIPKALSLKVLTELSDMKLSEFCMLLSEEYPLLRVMSENFSSTSMFIEVTVMEVSRYCSVYYTM